MKKRGFTLIELLSVIVVLAVIALVSVPVVLNIIEKVKIGAAEQSATAYIKDVETSLVEGLLKGNEYPDGEYPISLIDIKMNGITPNGGTIVIKSGKITKAVLCVNNYKIEYKNNISKKIANDCNGLDIIQDPEPTPDPEEPKVNPISGYSFDNISGNILVDTSGNGKHGVLTNVTVSSDGLLFDGNYANDYISLYEINDNKFTYSVTFKSSAYTTYQQAVVSNQENGGCAILVDSSKKLIGTCFIDGSYKGIKTPYEYELNKIYSATISFDENKFSFYVNGIFIGDYTSKDSGYKFPDNNTILMIGQNPNGIAAKGNKFVGSVYNLEIYDEPLESKKIIENQLNNLDKYKDKAEANYNIGIIADYNASSVSGTSFIDLTGNGNNGTVSGVKKVDNAIIFDGPNANDYIALSEKFEYPEFTYSTTFSYPETVSSSKFLMGNLEEAGCSIGISATNKAYGQCYIDGSYQAYSKSINPNQIYNLTITYDGKVETVYLDGVKLGSYTSTGAGITYSTNNTVMMFGQNPSGSTAKGQQFEGNLYDAKIYNRALTAKEVSDLNNSMKSKYTLSMNERLSTTLIADYNTTSISGSTFKDLSGHENNGSIVGPVLKNNKIYFDGVNDYIRLKQYEFSQFTIAVSFEPEVSDVKQSIFSNQENGGCGIIISAANNLYSGCHIDGEYRNLAYGKVNIGTKYTAVVTYDGKVNKLYVNGGLVKYYESTSGITATSPTTAYALGANPSGSVGKNEWFKGYIYNAKVYSRALTADEIANLSM